jgi:hypothetical protein
MPNQANPDRGSDAKASPSLESLQNVAAYHAHMKLSIEYCAV